MKKTIRSISVALTTVALLSSCAESGKSTKKEVDKKGRGINLEYMDTSVSPKEDFYQYVNGTWLKETEIPSDRTRWGGFDMLRKDTDNDMLSILDDAKDSGEYAWETDQGKALLVFSSITDTERRDAEGTEPLREVLEIIDGIQSVTDLQNVIAQNPTTVKHPFFGLSAFSNPNNSAINSAYLSTGSLGLPDRDYYLLEDEKMEEIREKYVQHVARMLQFIGEDEAEAEESANKILAFETRLVTPQLDKVERRDFRNYNNPHSVEEIQELVPAIQWEKFLTDLGIEKLPEQILVMQPKYMAELQKVLAEGDVELWKTIMRWDVINSAAGTLSSEIELADWEFYSKTLDGAEEQRPLRERALASVNGMVGEAVGKLYVDQKFPKEAKEKAEVMIADIIDAFQARIQNLEWMGEDTKAKAIEKLDKFTVKIGYPDKWKDYSDLEVKEGQSYYENVMAVSNWHFNRTLEKIDEPVDRTEWGMSPQTVNAYFSPLNNEIVFPAAILQPPFYDYKADDAVNYGGIGAVIGHEISHAFDDSGSRFDGDGNLNNWWTEEDLEQFTERTKSLADQYSAIEVLDGVYVNGEFTLGENIGDLGGVLGAYDGLINHLEKVGRPDNIDGFTPEQRFFMSWATIWRTKSRDEALRNQIKTDPHSPGQVRGVQPLLNVDAFYEAFDIQEGDAMYLEPEKRVRIW